MKSDYEKPIQCAGHNLKTRVLWAIFHNCNSDTLISFAFAFVNDVRVTCQTADIQGVDNSNAVATHGINDYRPITIRILIFISR